MSASITPSFDSTAQPLSARLSSQRGSIQSGSLVTSVSKLEDLSKEAPQFFSDHQLQMIASVGQSLRLSNSQYPSDSSLPGDQHSAQEEAILPNNDPRTADERIQAMKKGGTEREMLVKLLRDNDIKRRMDIITDYYCLTFGKAPGPAISVAMGPLIADQKKEGGRLTREDYIGMVLKHMASAEHQYNITEPGRTSRLPGGRKTEFWQPPCAE